MHVEVLQSGRVLRSTHHQGQVYLEAPPEGEYEIRLTNTSLSRRLAVVSVDGINVIDGKDAGYEGSGYVLNALQSMTIKGFLRSNSECARFTFAAAGGSYAAQTGRGTKNTGMIGVAVFDEKPKPPVFVPPTIIVKEEHHHHHHGWPYVRPWHPYRPDFWWECSGNSNNVTLGGSQVYGSTGGMDSMSFSCSTESTMDSVDLTAETQVKGVSAQAVDIGTAYGKAEAFYTSTTDFERATTAPAFVLTFRYGTAEKLKEWGVPVMEPKAVSAPTAFPASPGYAQPPAGWVR